MVLMLWLPLQSVVEVDSVVPLVSIESTTDTWTLHFA